MIKMIILLGVFSCNCALVIWFWVSAPFYWMGGWGLVMWCVRSRVRLLSKVVIYLLWCFKYYYPHFRRPTARYAIGTYDNFHPFITHTTSSLLPILIPTYLPLNFSSMYTHHLSPTNISPSPRLKFQTSMSWSSSNRLAMNDRS
ncbi:hypothetical protein M501DRAFT_579808 [Patellaria atrata CBS 101060]|uniref:Uncharacterized protein n=1 Tax=Patellaria atrata CBS 101060 TaxID=1346257 RepID=A0A9P4SH08_9PEZI|nr:hypothetical protein M501DRAFT_579808 [Patellaria atrata CBS 101060]